MNAMSDATQTERLKKLLQPDVVAELGARVRGPLDLLQLREQVEQWRRSRNEAIVFQEGPRDTSGVEVTRRSDLWRRQTLT